MTGATSCNCFISHFLWCLLLTFFRILNQVILITKWTLKCIKMYQSINNTFVFGTAPGNIELFWCNKLIFTFFLRANKNITLTLSWNVVPNAGILPLVAGNGHVSLPFPDAYETTRSYWDRVYTYHTTYICPYGFESFWFVIKMKIEISAFEIFLPNLYLHIVSEMNVWRLWGPAGNHYLG